MFHVQELLEPNRRLTPLTSIAEKKKEILNGSKVPIFLCVQQKTETHTGLQQVEGK